MMFNDQQHCPIWQTITGRHIPTESDNTVVPSSYRAGGAYATTFEAHFELNHLDLDTKVHLTTWLGPVHIELSMS